MSQKLFNEGKAGLQYTSESLQLFCPRLPLRDPSPFTRVTMSWGKGQSFKGLLDTDSEAILIPRDPKHHGGPKVRIKSYEG